jgi:hypothetical protein
MILQYKLMSSSLSEEALLASNENARAGLLATLMASLTHTYTLRTREIPL